MENEQLFANPNDDNWLERATVFDTTMRLLECREYDYSVGTWDFYRNGANVLNEDLLLYFATMLDATLPFIKEFKKVFKYPSPYSDGRIRICIKHDDSLLGDVSPDIYYHNEDFVIAQKDLYRIKPLVLERLMQYKSVDNKRPNTVEIIIYIAGQVAFPYPNDHYESSDFCSKLVQLEIRRYNVLTVKARNFAFLPNHPILRKKQYELWAVNAPRLAYCINFIINTKEWTLGVDQDIKDYGSFDYEVPGYLYNTNVSGVEWDEFYIPYELLSDPAK